MSATRQPKCSTEWKTGWSIVHDVMPAAARRWRTALYMFVSMCDLVTVIVERTTVTPPTVYQHVCIKWINENHYDLRWWMTSELPCFLLLFTYSHRFRLMPRWCTQETSSGYLALKIYSDLEQLSFVSSPLLVGKLFDTSLKKLCDLTVCQLCDFHRVELSPP